MDTALANGDFSPASNGRAAAIGGKEELFQRAAIRLIVPLGGFACDPSLGSRLHTLKADTEERDEKALAFAQEALRKLPQVSAVSAVCSAQEPISVQVGVQYGGETRVIEVRR